VRDRFTHVQGIRPVGLRRQPIPALPEAGLMIDLSLLRSVRIRLEDEARMVARRYGSAVEPFATTSAPGRVR
jgi:hypothetical protein